MPVRHPKERLNSQLAIRVWRWTSGSISMWEVDITKRVNVDREN